jgi:hypothetical protein
MLATTTPVTVTTYADNRHAIQFPVNSNIKTKHHTYETTYLNHLQLSLMNIASVAVIKDISKY